jgi:hypothetical protein
VVTAWRLAAGQRSMYAAFEEYGLPRTDEPAVELV